MDLKKIELLLKDIEGKLGPKKPKAPKGPKITPTMITAEHTHPMSKGMEDHHHGVDLSKGTLMEGGITEAVGLMSHKVPHPAGGHVMVKQAFFNPLEESEEDQDKPQSELKLVKHSKIENPFMDKSFDSFTTAHREAAYYNMARDAWGLDKHVPKTTLVSLPEHKHVKQAQARSHGSPIQNLKYHSVQKFIDNGVAPYKIDNKEEFPIMKDSTLHHKLALMNIVSGNYDRHGNNFLYTPDNIHLIDNGNSYNYEAQDKFHSRPQYLNHLHQEYFKPSAIDWFNNLDEEKIGQMADKHLPKDKANKFKNTFQHVKGIFASGDPSINELTTQIKNYTTRMGNKPLK